MSSLTPQDIQSQQFTVRFRGFDVDEVDNFLEKVADDFLTLIQENKQLKERLEELTGNLKNYREQERSFQKAIVSAQQIVDTMKEQSRQEAEQIVAKAREQAGQLTDEAQREVAAQERLLDEFKRQKQQIKNELRTLLQTYMQRLDEDADPEPVAAAARPARAEAKKSEEVDLDDLYQKIDIPEEEYTFSAEEAAGDSLFSMADPGEPATGLPDIGGEMLFDLDDPLDDLTPDIKIKDHADGK